MSVKNFGSILKATNAQILAWAEAQPWAREMAACQQDAQWHAEGDVWTHTSVVCTELERLADWLSHLGGGAANGAGSSRGFARVFVGGV